MMAESGAQLLDPGAQGALVAEILPRATVLTPNLPEAQALVGQVRRPTVAGRDEAMPAGSEQEEEFVEEAQAHALVRAILALGPDIVVLTGGHRREAIDLFLDSSAPERIVSIPGKRHPDGAAHGSGCTHSSVLAAQLALGRAPLQAAFAARALVGVAIASGLRDVGEGPGPVDVIGLARIRPR
jgi:hydroxymethylpyrimidine/phosphomethylpyrimidine kinase